MKAPLPLERQIHLGVAKLLREHARPGIVWFHPANERKCSVRQGAFLKAIGVMAGVSDLIIITNNNYQPFLWFLEIKRPKESLSVAQKRFRDAVEALGCVYAVARSTDEAAVFLKLWGVLRSHKPVVGA